MVVEAPGGLLDDLNDGETVASMAVALRLPLVIVTRPEPGALNAVALTLSAARAHGLEVAGSRSTPARAGRRLWSARSAPSSDAWPT